MNCSRVVSIFASVILIFLFIGLSSSTKMEESDSSSSSGDCDNPTLTSMFKGQNRQKRAAPLRVTECQDRDSLNIEIACDPGSTIKITKGACVRVPSCDAYDPFLDSECYNSDKTAQWAPYCETENPCRITSTCNQNQPSTCPGEYTYLYADYECVPGETNLPTALTSATPENQTPTPAYVVRQKTSLFKRIHQGWRLRNHVIKTKHGLSLVICGAECNTQDDCVSFNIGNGVCELNNRVVGGTGVIRDDFVKDEGFNYYEEQ